MSKVCCYECKKTYDYNDDGFCPRCGSFNQPPRQRRIDASGNIVYADGINENNHEDSFVHKEYHAENARRRRTPLEKKASRPAAVKTTPPSQAKSPNLAKLLVPFIFAMFLLLKITLEVLL